MCGGGFLGWRACPLGRKLSLQPNGERGRAWEGEGKGIEEKTNKQNSIFCLLMEKKEKMYGLHFYLKDKRISG